MKILHLERSDFFRKIINRINNDGLVKTFNSSTIKEAFEILEKEEIDLIISGQELNDGSAKEFLLKLEETDHKSIPVIIVTSHDSLESREEYFNLGVVDFISKIDFNLERISRHIDHYKQQDMMIEALKMAPIAILDDSKLLLKVIKSILNRHGINNVDTFLTPDDLFVSAKNYHIYLIDLMLPHMPGEQVIRTLRKKYKEAVILVVSSIDKYNTIVHVLESGADDYVIKPFEARLLMARLKTNYRHFLLNQELKNQKKILEAMSFTDSLTGAVNHRFLMNSLEEAVMDGIKGESRFSLLLLDIDHFKRVNDLYGHPSGDVVLKRIASQFKENSPDNYVFGRYGGEEFILIMHNTDLDRAKDFCEGQRVFFKQQIFDFTHTGHDITFSGGLIQWGGESYQELLKMADHLLYKAKEGGRNRIEA